MASSEKIQIPAVSSESSNSSIAEFITSKPDLMALLENRPKLKDSLTILLEEEKKFQDRQQSQKQKYQARGHSSSNLINQQQPNRELSPLEKRLIEARESDEQKILRLLLNIIHDTL